MTIPLHEFRTNTATLIHQLAVHKALKTMNVEPSFSQVDLDAICQPLPKRLRKH